VDVTELQLNLCDIYFSSNLWFTLIEEILNNKKICNIKIDKFVTDFFINNFDFCLLLNKEMEKYEIPMAVYVGKEEKKLNFTYVFGESSKDKNAILGPYYYFTNYTQAVRDGCWSPDFKPVIKNGKLITNNEFGRYIRGGVVRFAIFMSNTKYIENLPNDPTDDSDIKKERLTDLDLDLNFERLTLRISDHNGNWMQHTDSCYLGKIELDNGEKMKNVPLYVLKEYNQQIPLSYHFIDKASLLEKFDENQNYVIM
jgi:hypothetical protein